MATLEKIRNEESSYTDFAAAMPSRAKYFQTENDISAAFKNARTASRYSNYTAKEENANAGGGLVIENEELKRDIRAGNPDILPTGATLKMLRESNAPAKPFDDTIAVSYRVNAKGKLLFALYAVAVLTLIMVIVLNALAIERQKTENAGIENQIVLMGSAVADLQNEAASLNDSAYIYSQAQSYGMKPVNTVNVNIATPQFAEAEQYKPVTNWFDGICDLLG